MAVLSTWCTRPTFSLVVLLLLAPLTQANSQLRVQRVSNEHIESAMETSNFEGWLLASASSAYRLKSSLPFVSLLGGGSTTAKAGQEPEPEEAEEWTLRQRLSSCFIWGTLISLVALWYTNSKQFPPAEAPGAQKLKEDQFTFPLFSCFSEPQICCFTCCCWPIRWADTMRMAGLMSFWAALFLFLGIEVVAVINSTIGTLLLVCVTVYYRQKLRAMFNFNHSSFGVILGDICAYCCCMCCAVIQEARQLEVAYQTKHPAVGQMQTLV